MSKSTRKLIPALVMLLVSAVMLSTASYAWFASSKTVTASGMGVNVKSDAKYLQISDAGKNTFDSSATLTPAIQKELNLATAEIQDDNAIVWKTGDGANADSPALKGELRTIEDENLDLYVLSHEFTLRLVAGEETASVTNVRVGSVTIDNNTSNLTSAIRVLVKGANGVQAFTTNKAGDGTVELTLVADDAETNADSSLIDTLTKGADQNVTVYIFYEGNDESAYINNTETLGNINVTVTFIAD